MTKNFYDPLASDQAPVLAIYGVGQFGSLITRMAVEKNWRIAAAYNRAGEKVGKDLGQVAGLGRDLGIVIEDCDKADFSASEANIGIVAVNDRLEVNMPAYRRLLGAGINVLCHGTESYFPSAFQPEFDSEIDILAKQQGVTFSGSGIWDMTRIWSGILLSGPCTQIDAVTHTSVTDAERWGKQLARAAGIGMSVEGFAKANEGGSGFTNGLYPSALSHVLTSLGYHVVKVSERVEPVVFEKDFFSKVLDETIPAGTCVGTRIVAELQTEEGLGATAKIDVRVLQEGEQENMAWSLEGRPSLRIRVERDDSAYASASSLFNRIPDVLAAQPGVVLLSELGPLRHTALA